MERQLICSNCMKVFAESKIHVIPAFNESVGKYVTTFRCDDCWVQTLEATRERLATIDDYAELASAAEVFRGGNVYVHEYLRGDSATVVQGVLLGAIELLRSGRLRLTLGPTVSGLPGEDSGDG